MPQGPALYRLKRVMRLSKCAGSNDIDTPNRTACAWAPSAAPPRRLMNSRRRISAPKVRGQHCIGSNEYFDRAETEHQNQCRSAQPMSEMGHFRQTDPLPTLSACPLRSHRVRTFAAQQIDAGDRRVEAENLRTLASETMDLYANLAKAESEPKPKQNALAKG